ncbi:uncharacterized protein LAESUDRAFT_319487 [Laetiporus sulphureus 93-53]|uniref:Peptidase C14 caspase domain-containing protein n=1 Tax=Laetiporus sulphureus 93-53 TaxID=1314785 RepID=A0A165D1C9_9APHY|nr:uncharacterized protein LAESUDRAFT_319487 [Laetiporus sulphureus 93-53]KZT03947.1 hypothetical protein LAESUDRAFT_319487 [Laetiporus sulphureus 93-53]
MVPTDGTSGSSHASGKQILSDDEQSPLTAEQDCGGDACAESSEPINKKAVIIGINYAGNMSLPQLNGCHNDAFNMKQCLVKCRGFLEEHITLLIDDGNNATPQPNRQTIIQELRNLVQDAQSDDWLFLHFSGHGAQLPAIEQDEVDGKDEDILPSDYDAVEPIRDNELNDILVKRLPRRCLLTCVFDSCHSESIMDLPLVYNGDNYLHSEVTEAFREAKGSLGHVACFSACVDEGTAQEIRKGGMDVGAYTNALIQVMEMHPHCTCVQCVQEVNKILKEEELTQTAHVSVVDKRDIRQDIFFGRACPVVSSTHTM